MEAHSLIFEQRYPAKASILHNVRKDLRDLLFQQQLASFQVDQLILAANEACTNIIEHGYSDSPGEFILEIFMMDAEIAFRITDFAKPVDDAITAPRTLDDSRPGGLGVHFMHQLMDHIEFSRKPDNSGNILFMKKHLG